VAEEPYCSGDAGWPSKKNLGVGIPDLRHSSRRLHRFETKEEVVVHTGQSAEHREIEGVHAGLRHGQRQGDGSDGNRQHPSQRTGKLAPLGPREPGQQAFAQRWRRLRRLPHIEKSIEFGVVHRVRSARGA
jgi:hypothetical protein